MPIRSTSKSRLVEAAYKKALDSLEIISESERRQLRAQHGLGNKQGNITPSVVVPQTNDVHTIEKVYLEEDLTFKKLLSFLQYVKKSKILIWNIKPMDNTGNLEHKTVVFHM